MILGVGGLEFIMSKGMVAKAESSRLDLHDGGRERARCRERLESFRISKPYHTPVTHLLQHGHPLILPKHFHKLGTKS